MNHVELTDADFEKLLTAIEYMVHEYEDQKQHVDILQIRKLIDTEADSYVTLAEQIRKLRQAPTNITIGETWYGWL